MYKSPKYFVKPLNMPAQWQRFLGDIPADEQWTMLLFGNSHSGKSSFALIFGQILSNFGKVLYANTEENLKGGTIQRKARLNNVDITKFDFLDEDPQYNYYDSFNEIVKRLENGDYKYCIIDSLSEFAMTRTEVIKTLNLKRQFPNVSFIFITHMTKDEKSFSGYATIKYKVDIAIETKDGVASCQPKNRYKFNIRNMELKFF